MNTNLRPPLIESLTRGGLTRRAFLATGAALTAAASVPAAAAQERSTPAVCVFSKHLQFLDYDELAKSCSDIGLDGVDLTVRPNGHVLPEKVRVDLPRAVETIRAAGLEVPMITTNLNNLEGDHARAIIETAVSLNIPYFRIGNHTYDTGRDPWPQLARFIEELRPLIAAAEPNMVAGYHNHSGHGNVGAPLWDLYHMIREIDSPSFGSNFDFAHTTVEGAFGAWEINTRLIAPLVKMAAIKDFVWDVDKPKWVPLGQGIVKRVEILKILREAGFAGPISMHFEYDVPREKMLQEVAATAATVRETLIEAGYPSS